MSDEMTKEDVDGAGRELLHKFMAALNAHNAAGMDACLHFPHMRIGNGRVDVWDEPGANPMDMFERLKREDGWHSSTWDDIQLVQWGPLKAHFTLDFTRYREDGSIIGVYETLCILMLKDGKWGMHARSSYGP
ncbi:MAG: hypothetical protein HOK25_08970 [Rhodospirillaceae bacterium]|nr:hypothetical protein [Rhodospirillaceae bacterium]MBT5300153.1 hypothetical protein [Rhodospirillaceae bacterium]MBT5514200.1 hypothetical protein [Rhodospirillaceae bacterium]MBT6084638.1 hypothetical protein [Rhodospirillaceae bacterium]MBT7509288.1 hypothetical protein [Rhodospirillaceae bacterium]